MFVDIIRDPGNIRSHKLRRVLTPQTTDINDQHLACCRHCQDRVNEHTSQDMACLVSKLIVIRSLKTKSVGGK